MPFRIGLTLGDTGGINTELLAKLVLLSPPAFRQNKLVVYGPYRAWASAAPILRPARLPDAHVITEPTAAQTGRLNWRDVWPEAPEPVLGQATPAGGEAAFRALDAAVRDAQAGKLDALVTLPINKKTIQREGFRFPGHTEYLGEAFRGKPLMLMVHEGLRVALATGHIPLHEVPGRLTARGLVEKLGQLQLAIQVNFGMAAPKLAMLSLNPHAGDEGLLGHEEQTMLMPAIKAARDANLDVAGPFPADGFFATRAFQAYDGVLALYHDQGLVGFKAVCGGAGVNFTAGLSIVRTSPDHGPAFGIAGRHTADPTSTLEALALAANILAHRRRQAANA